MTRRLWVETLGFVQGFALFLFGVALGVQFGVVGTGNDLVPSARWFILFHVAVWLSLWIARETVAAPLERSS